LYLTDYFRQPRTSWCPTLPIESCACPPAVKSARMLKYQQVCLQFIHYCCSVTVSSNRQKYRQQGISPCPTQSAR
jgi:hypothetical protein